MAWQGVGHWPDFTGIPGESHGSQDEVLGGTLEEGFPGKATLSMEKQVCVILVAGILR